MQTEDKVFLVVAVMILPPLVAFGGLFPPNTLAGAFARFVFSLA